MKAFSQQDCAQSITPNVTQLSGAGLKTRPGIGVNGQVTIELWANGLPGQGGNMIATGTDTSVNAGEWAEVSFGGCVAVTPGVKYYLVFRNNNNSLGIQGDTANPYPGGNVYANPGYQSFPNFDYTFYTACDCVSTVCKYKINKSKAKGGCQACPAKNTILATNQACSSINDCRKKLKTTIACPNGGPGSCKIKAKADSCS